MNLHDHVSYLKLCEDPTCSPLGTGPAMVERIAEYFTPWKVDPANAASSLTADDLLKEVLMDMGVTFPGAIGVFLRETGTEGGVLELLHSPAQHTLRDTHRGKTFVYHGDLEGQDINLLEFDSNLLSLTDEATTADSIARQQEIFTANDALKLAPTFGRRELRTQKLRTRNSMFIPYPLVPYVLDRQLSAKEAFDVLVPVIQSLELTDACKPLLDFLLIATTQSAGVPNEPLTLQDSLGVTPSNARAIHQTRRTQLLYHHLPAARPSNAPRSDPALLGMLTEMRQVREATQDDLEDRRNEREKVRLPKTVEEKWPSMADRLCKLCNVEDPTGLPQFWHEAAALKKGSGTIRSLLQDAVETSADRFKVQTPHVTVAHATTLTNWAFAGTSLFNVGTGLLPFTVTPPGAVSMESRVRFERDQERSADHDTIMEGSTSITASDARSFRTAGAFVPSSFDETEATLEGYGALLGAVLGNEHPNVVSHFESIDNYRTVRHTLRQAITDVVGRAKAPATLLYYYQVRHRRWFERQWKISTTATLPPPDFSAGFERYAESLNIDWLPNTSQVLVFQRLRDTPPQDSDERLGRNVGGSSTSNTTGTTVSDLTQDKPEETERKRVRNNNRDPRFKGRTPLAVMIRSAKIQDAIDKQGCIPVTPDGEERCLSWHLKGTCYGNCERASDHVVLKGAEKEELHKWAAEGFARE